MYDLHIYIDADYNKNNLSRLRLFFTPSGNHMVFLLHVCKVLLSDFVKKSEFACCFWSAKCIGRQATTFVNVKTWVFSWLNVQWWSVIDNVVYGKTLCSIEVAFVEVEMTMLTLESLALMFTIITRSKQSDKFHAC